MSGGALTLGSDVGSVLRLNGAFPWDLGKRFEPRNQPAEWFDFPVINGESIDGDRITLLRSAVTRTRTTLGTQSQELQATDVLVGEHLEEPTPLFDGVVFELSHLADWSRPSGLGPVTESGDEEQFVVTYSRKPPRTAAVTDLGEVALIRDFKYASDVDVYTLRDYAGFGVRFGQPVSIDAVFADAIRPLQDLLTFAEMRPSKPRGVLVTCPGLHVVAGLDSQSRLAVYRAGIDRPEMAPTADSNPYRRLFALESCPVPFDQLVVNWFGLGKQLGPIIDLYLAIDYAPPVHMETRFINTCQAAEGYHRAVSTGTVMEPSEHRAIIRGVLDACPDDRREWLRGVLAHSNEPSFKRRIDELVDRAGQAVKPLIDTRPKYSATMRDYRHNFAHWLSTEPPAEDLGRQLHDLIRVTRFVLAACFLQDIGWSPAEVDAVLRQNSLFAQAVREGRNRP